jgi:hypothetical protein
MRKDSGNNSGSTSATTKVPLHRSQTVNSVASRNDSHKPTTRIGDQTTLIKKGKTNASANAARFMRSGDGTIIIRGPAKVSVTSQSPHISHNVIISPESASDNETLCEDVSTEECKESKAHKIRVTSNTRHPSSVEKACRS